MGIWWWLGPPSSNRCSSFIAKLNLSGAALVWSVCLTLPSGGPIALDEAGAIYVLGGNASSSTITKLTPQADRILYSTTITVAQASSFSVDHAGNVYVTGTAGPGLPTTPGAYQTLYMSGNCSAGGESSFPCNDSFVFKLNQTGAVVYGTYMGTTGAAQAVAFDSQGSAWITGYTDGGGGFVAKLDATGSSLLYSKFFADDSGYQTPLTLGLGIAVDSEGAAYVVGESGPGVPTTPGALQPNGPSFAGTGFIIKFSSAGEIVYGTYVGTDYQSISSVAVDQEGNAYFGLNGLSEVNGAYSACGVAEQSATSLIVLSPDGSKILASAVNFPGPAKTVVLDGMGGVYITGTTYTSVFLSTPQAFQTEYPPSSGSAFAAKFDFSQPAGMGLNCLVNAGSLSVGMNNSRGTPDGAVAPGEVVTLFGLNFSPGAGLKVTFDGASAPLIYADTGQINAVVPFDVQDLSGSSTLVSIQSGEQTFGPVKLPVAPAQPGLFTRDGSGRGQAAILNQDGTLNSSTSPASAGSVVAVYMTGVGDYKQKLLDGSLGPLDPPFPSPVLGVSATINGEQAPVLFVGQASGLIAGVVQVNVQVPGDVKSGMATLVVYVGDYVSSYTGPNLAIR